MKKNIKKKYHILSFILPLLIYLIVLFLKKVIPNIEAFFVSDLRVQHLPFLNYLKNVLLGNDSIYYSYFAGMGNTMISTLVFYAISPLNILLVIIKDIRYAILVIYLLKVCLSSLTMFIFLKSKFKKECLTTVIFSSCYALSSYMINYFFCIFWFDAVYLAPLVLLGIDKIFEKEKMNLTYIIFLSLAIICNIQMGFGLCVFSIIYYFYSFNIKYSIKRDLKKFKKLSLILIISSLCAGGISSGFILAFLSDYNTTNLARNIGEKSYSETSSIDSIIKNLFSIGKIKINYYNDYEPLIYCGLVITLLSIISLFDKSIDKKKRRCTLIVILVFIISFCVKNLNILWHLSQPIYLNFRYSIYLCLFLILISYEYYIQKNKFTKQDTIILIISILIGLLFVTIYQKEIYLIHTIFFLILNGFLIILVKNISQKFEIILFLTMFIELSFNTYLSFYTSNDLPIERYSSYDSFIKLYSSDNFDKSYRVSYDYSYAEYDNDGLILNKNSSVRYFSSIINGNIIKFVLRNYSPAAKNGYAITSYDSALLLSLFGNKYFYQLDDVDSGLYKKINTYKIKSYDYVKKKDKYKKVYLYENPYSLSLGYVINKDAKYSKKYSLVDYQNNIIKSFTGNNKEVIKKIDFTLKEHDDYCENITDHCNTFHVENNTNNDYVYIYAPDKVFDPNNEIDIYSSYYNCPYLIKSKKKQFEISITNIDTNNLNDITFATYNKENLIYSLKILQENMLTEVKIKKNIMKAKLDSSKDGILFLSIPYDKNFKIYVDGKKIKYYSLLDNTFIGLDIKKGNHNIKIINKNDRLTWYILSSTISLIITLILYKHLNEKYNTENKL